MTRHTARNNFLNEITLFIEIKINLKVILDHKEKSCESLVEGSYKSEGNCLINSYIIP